MSTNAALRKMMTFAYSRYMKATVGLFANDQTAYFDRIWAEVTNAIASASGGDINMLKCQSITIENTARHVKMGLGVLKVSYLDDIPPESRLS